MNKKVDNNVNNILQNLLYEENHHIHKLLGFYDFEINSYISILSVDIKKKFGNENSFTISYSDKKNTYDKHKKEIETAIIEYILSDIKDNKIIFNDVEKKAFIKNPYNFSITLNCSLVKYYEPEKKYNESINNKNNDKEMVGGEILINCSILKKIKSYVKFIKVYGEPVTDYFDREIINLVIKFVSTRYPPSEVADTIKLIIGEVSPIPGEPVIFNYNIGFSQDCNNYIKTQLLILVNILRMQPTTPDSVSIINKIDIVSRLPINDILSGSYKKDILDEHIIENNFVHNGFNDNAKLQILKESMRGENDFIKSQFIHSYLHIFDYLLMFTPKESCFNTRYEYLKSMRNSLLEGIEGDNAVMKLFCFENELNKNQFSFLLQAANGKYVRNPTTKNYYIRPEAVEQKNNQYFNNLISSDPCYLQVNKDKYEGTAYGQPLRPVDPSNPWTSMSMRTSVLSTTLYPTEEVDFPPAVSDFIFNFTPEERKNCKRIIKIYIDEYKDTNGNIKLPDTALKEIITKINNCIGRSYRGVSAVTSNRYDLSKLLQCVKLLKIMKK